MHSLSPSVSPSSSSSPLSSPTTSHALYEPLLSDQPPTHKYATPSCFYAYLAVNLAKDAAASRTEIRVHPYPQEAMFIRNQLQPASSSCWTVVETVGPFTVRHAAEDYAALWMTRTRRPTCLTAKGLVLGRHLDRVDNRRPHDDMDVPMRLEVTAVPAAEHQRRLQRRHSVYEPSRRPFAGLRLDRRRDNNDGDDGSTALESPPRTALYPRPSQIQLHDVQQGWLRPEAFY